MNSKRATAPFPSHSRMQYLLKVIVAVGTREAADGLGLQRDSAKPLAEISSLLLSYPGAYSRDKGFP